MIELNQSQLDFCESDAQNIRLLAPAGCGKTASLLHRCRELIQRAEHKPRFLIVTFTKAATTELRERLDSDEYFQPVRGQATITTLNSYGWRRIRDQVSGARLLTTPSDRHFAMKNQLRPVWIDKHHIEQVVKRGSGSRKLMTVMDNMKAMGFVHTRDVNRDLYQSHLDALQEQGLSWRIDEQFDLLTKIGVLDRPKRGDMDAPSTSKRDFYDRFFIFWRDAVKRLLEESTFTYEDQKYWNYLDLNSSVSNDISRPVLSGAARYNHILVDEFQDINPLDLNFIKSIAQRHRATLTIIGDDDQAIFEWRGATPEYILHPDQYFGTPFHDYQLQINYRSPKNIVELSQKLISNNKNRVDKQVVANKDSNIAIIEVQETDSINERLRMVTDIVQNSEDHYPGTVAVIGRLRRQLIPYQIYFVSDGAPFKTAIDLDVFNNEAFDGLVKLLEIWERSQNNRRISIIIDDVQSIYSFIRRWPLNKKDCYDLGAYLRESGSVNTVVESVSALRYYTDPKIGGKKTLKELHDIAIDFLSTTKISEALKIIDKDFDGLRFDQEKAESDVFFTDPPLAQLADIVEAEDMDVMDLIERIEAVKVQTEEYRRQSSEENDLDVASALERPLHLMTATRAKGKEFDTVILLDTVEGVWPHKRATDQREMEAERRLFYVAFTRARHRVVMLVSRETDSTSRFLEELGIE